MSVYAFIQAEAEKTGFPVAFMCRHVGVSRSGCYAWQQRAPSARSTADAALTETIRQIHAAIRQTYGAPRIRAERAHAHAVACGRKRVARLMRGAGVVGVSRRRVRTTRCSDSAAPAHDLVQHAFNAAAADQLWVADITYLPTAAGFLFLATVLDAFSRRVVGWSMAPHLRTELVLNAVEMAQANR